MLSRNLRDKLIERVSAPIEDFAKLGKTQETLHGPLTYIDRGSNILAVGHLDFVLWQKPKLSRSAKTIKAGQLDDRLGVWVILDLLPVLGVNVDVLLTDSEEVGASTAQYFKPEKDYNWMVEFDRAGTDVVMYRYRSESNRKLVEEFGFKTGWGSFTDICYLKHLGVSGFNIGTGYYAQHTSRCHAKLRETLVNARKFRNMWQKYKDVEIPAPKVETNYTSWHSSYQYGKTTKSYNEPSLPLCKTYRDTPHGLQRVYPKGYGSAAELYLPKVDARFTDPYHFLDDVDDQDRYLLSNLLSEKGEDRDYQCPQCMAWNDSPISCAMCGCRYYECKKCGEVMTNWDWECEHCGTPRDDMREQEFLNQFEAS